MYYDGSSTLPDAGVHDDAISVQASTACAYPRSAPRREWFGEDAGLMSILVHQYRGSFELIKVWPPSVDIDMAWVPVESYVEHELKVDLSKEFCLFGDWDPTTLEQILNEQSNVEYQKKRGYKGCVRYVLSSTFAHI